MAVQIDAHADLRDEYEGSPFSHACAARRILDVCPVFQIGIRNISAGEEPFRRSCDRVQTVFAEESTAADGAFLKELAAFVRGKQVFLTIDLDGLDPSIMPAVGTPEPGGLSWQRMLEICADGLPRGRRRAAVRRRRTGADPGLCCARLPFRQAGLQDHVVRAARAMRPRRYNHGVMRYKGVVKNGVIVLEPGAKLPEGTEVRVEPLPVRVEQLEDDANAPTLLERLASIVGKAEGLPPDAAANIDRDLYGRSAE